MVMAPARLARSLAKLLAAASVTPVLAVACVSGRRGTIRRRETGLPPRLAWGPTPIISIRNWSRGMHGLGYESTTLVWDVYPIHERSDFDLQRTDFGPKTKLFEPWRDYAPFVWVLRNADIVLTFFDGGFLQNTPYLADVCLRPVGHRLESVTAVDQHLAFDRFHGGGGGRTRE